MKKKFVLSTILLTALLIFQLTALAAGGTLNISTDSNISKGDIFDVVISFTSKDEAIGSLQASLEYDDSALEYMSGGGNAVELSEGTGGISDIGSEDIYNFTYVLRFKALKEGMAALNVKSFELTGFISGDDLASGSKEMKISISSGNPDKTNSPQNDDPIAITIDNKTAYLLRDFGDKTVPAGFTKAQISYEGQTISGAVNEELGLKIVCIMDAGGNTGLFLYFEEDKSFFPFVQISENREYILTNAPQDPEGYTRSTVDFNGKTITIWTSLEDDVPLVYAVTSEEKGAFYHFDLQSGKLLDSPFSMSVESSQGATPAPSPSGDSQGVTASYSPWTDNNMMLYLYALGALAAVFIVAVIIAKVKRRANSEEQL